ncbi:hypothetical protein DPEC_G00325320 [Dallia pectoralis]|uniref:Uncharacterized protein n=1 Tax=Dallia pectoralis TaxID=75939 RepID=A0ACC2F7J1_DALPE|nr:hypothetical protein DPEC_G00325320 [Dallia pectoralis]
MSTCSLAQVVSFLEAMFLLLQKTAPQMVLRWQGYIQYEDFALHLGLDIPHLRLLHPLLHHQNQGVSQVEWLEVLIQ